METFKNYCHIPASCASSMLNKRSWLRANSMLLMCVSLILGMRPALSQQEVNMSPIISETVVMLYYKDITAASAFFGETLGLEMTFSQEVLKPIADSSTNPIRAFLIEDPGGYTIEFFSWKKVVDTEASN